MRSLRGRNKYQRRGAAAVYLAISMTTVFGMAALAVDVGTLYSAKAELQRAADSAALAAASFLVDGGTSDVEDLAFATADSYARMNEVLNAENGLSESGDVELGRAVYDPVSGRFDFQATSAPYDAVRVTVRRTEGSEGGPIGLAFARLFGHDSQGLTARAAAMLVPRDISVVIDLSGSMNDDSGLVYWSRTDGGYANTRDIWAALDGPEPSRPYLPGSELDTEYASDTGPTFGLLNNWGDPLLPSSYSASSDPGLLNIPRYGNISNSTIQNSLTSRGYSADEISVLLSGSRDSNSTHWKDRVGVLLGLAEWRSGRPGGKYTSGGDGDSYVESGEMLWVAYPSWRVSGWTWLDYVNWVATTSQYSSGNNAGFRNRYGLKTFIDYLLVSYPQITRNNNLWATPEQPVQAVKDAVQTMVDVISELDSMDHVSLEVFATTSRHEVNLTDDLQTVAETLYHRQAGHYDTTTNIASGLAQAINELQSARARPNANKLIILMSDGVPNTDEQGNYLGDGSDAARQYAVDRAQQAADLNFRIYTVSVGYYSDRPLMQEIAAIGRGEEFYAAGSPEEYQQQLEDIFRSLGGKRPVALIE
ncbi:MAG: VWA domain-containing protein [Phycisphaerae bacterium]|jgi:hypothetical protein